MQDSLFNVMNEESIASAIAEQVKASSPNDLLTAMLCKGMSSDFSVEDFGSIRAMTLVNDYKKELLDSPFSLKVEHASLEEERLSRLTYMLDALEFKEDRYLSVSQPELEFYDGMLDIVSGESHASLEAASAFGSGEKSTTSGGYVEKGVIKRVATTIMNAVKTVLKIFITLVSNFVGFLSKSFELVSKFLTWVKSVIDGGAEKVGFKEAYVPKALEKKIKDSRKSKIKDAGKNIASVLKGANSVDVTDEGDWTRFKELSMKAFPGDLEKQTAGEYIKALVDPTEPTDPKETTLITADEFINMLKRVDTDHTSAMKTVKKEADKLNKTLTAFDRENSKYYNEMVGANNNETGRAKEEYKRFSSRISYLRKIVQICTMMEDQIVKEELEISRLLQSAKPKN